MKIYQKVSLIISLCLFATILLTMGVLVFFQELNLEKAESLEVQASNEIVRATHRHLHTLLEAKIADWANWDDAYNYVMEPNEKFVQTNIGCHTLKNAHLHVAMFGNPEGHFIGGIACDADHRPVELPKEFLNLAQSKFPGLGAGPARDFLIINGVIYVYQIRKVFPSNSEGFGAGYLLFASQLNQAVLNELSEIAGMPLKISLQPLIGEYQVQPKAILGGVQFQNQDGSGVFSIRYEIPRKQFMQYEQAKTNIYASLAALFPLAVVMSIVITFVFVSKPLRLLRDQLSQVLQADSEQYLPEDKKDEITEISSRINELKRKNVLIEKDRDFQRSLSIHRSRISSLGEMASGIAHEINNPLAIIKGKIQTVKHKLAEENKVDIVIADLDKMDSTVDRISKIIKGLRTFARSDEKVPFQQISMQVLVQEVLDLCSTKLNSHGIQVRLKNIGQQVLTCRSIQIQQVLVNLFNNSIYAIDNLPSKWIEVEVVEEESSTSIMVTDSGSGIPSEIASKIMDPFYTTKPVGEGTGLGLSISYSILKEHGGEFLYDKKCKNTRFILCLPKTIANQDAA